MENNSHEVTQGPRRGQWIGLTVALVAVVGLSYGAFRFSNESDHAAPAGQLSAGALTRLARVSLWRRTIQFVSACGLILVSLYYVRAFVSML